MVKQDYQFGIKTKQLLESNKDRLTKDDLSNINDLIMHGEAGVAYEILCDQLYEYSCPITKESYDLIVDIGQSMDHDESFWLHLKELVIGGV